MWFRTELLMVFVAIFATQSTHSQDPLTHPDQQQHQSPLVRTKRMFAMCPPKFAKIGNECYFISKFKVNWLDAHFECKDRNSKLAEPMKYEDRQLRKNLLRNDIDRTDVWIGGIYNWERNKWQWGYNGKDIKYQSFSQMEPGSSRDLRFHCAVLNPELKYRWSARSCVERHHFICQHRMPYVTEKNRIKVYEKWNQTFPNEFVNEVEVKVAGDSSHRKRDYYRIQNQRRRSSNHPTREQDEGFLGNVQLGYNKAGGLNRVQKIGQKRINNEVTNDLRPVEPAPTRHDGAKRRRKHKFHKQANLPLDMERGEFQKNNVHMSGNDVMKPLVIEDAPDPMQELNTVPKLTMLPQERPIPRRRKPHGRRRTTTTTTTVAPPVTEESMIDETRRLAEVINIEEDMDKALRKLEDFTTMPEVPSTTVEHTTTTTTTTEQPTTTTTTTTEEPTTSRPATPSSTTEAYGLPSSGLTVEEEKKARREELRRRLQMLSPEQQRRFFELRKLRKTRKSNLNETSK